MIILAYGAMVITGGLLAGVTSMREVRIWHVKIIL